MTKKYVVVGEEYACDDCWLPKIVTRGSYEHCEYRVLSHDGLQYRNLEILTAEEAEEYGIE
jgi:hypothetical protein